jgi:hypothetical protein
MGPNVLISKKVPDFMCRWCAEDAWGLEVWSQTLHPNFGIGATTDVARTLPQVAGR